MLEQAAARVLVNFFSAEATLVCAASILMTHFSDKGTYRSSQLIVSVLPVV
jgi:hypothetical protein